MSLEMLASYESLEADGADMGPLVGVYAPVSRHVCLPLQPDVTEVAFESAAAQHPWGTTRAEDTTDTRVLWTLDTIAGTSNNIEGIAAVALANRARKYGNTDPANGAQNSVLKSDLAKVC